MLLLFQEPLNLLEAEAIRNLKRILIARKPDPMRLEVSMSMHFRSSSTTSHVSLATSSPAPQFRGDAVTDAVD